MDKLIKDRPIDNPMLVPGIYHAVIVQARVDTYGEHLESECFKATFWLPAMKCNIVTHIHFPYGKSHRSGQRLWHLCGAVGLDPDLAREDPAHFLDRELRVELHRVESSNERGSWAYCDVRRFLPVDCSKNAMSQEISEETPLFSDPML